MCALSVVGESMPKAAEDCRSPKPGGTFRGASGSVASEYVARFVDWAEAVLAEEFDESGYTTLFVGAEMVVDVPAEIIFAEFGIVFGPAADDVIEGFQAEFLGFAQAGAERFVIDGATQCPDSVDKRQSGQFEPGGAEIEYFVGRGSSDKVERGIADEQNSVEMRRRAVGIEGKELRLQPSLCEQYLKQIYTGKRSGVAKDF